MTEYQTKYNETRKDYVDRLKKVSEEFLAVFYENVSYGNVPSNRDLLSVVIIQNLEILDFLRQPNDLSPPYNNKGVI